MQIGENYTIIRPLGRGGDGDVYLVRHIPTEQLRAAKKIKERIADYRFHELEMMKHLHHPSLPVIYDVICEQNQQWLIMEYIRGDNLQEIAASKMSADQFYKVALQLSEVLLYLHTRSVPVLHLDVKPTNILVKKNGVLVLIDFGAAIRGTAGDSLCRGTPGFAAPEQRDRNGQVDVRTDVYGFGATMYYCLYQKTVRQEHGHFQSVVLWKAEAARMLKRCLQPDKNSRFQDMQILSRAVHRRRYRRSVRKKFAAMAVAGALMTTILLFLKDGENLRQRKAVLKEEQVEELLTRAEGAGLEQAFLYYEEAAKLETAHDIWCMHLIDRVLADYLFDEREEAVIGQLLYKTDSQQRTTEELLREYPEVYGEFAYKLGSAYWYFYEGSGGKSAAYRWFTKAIESVKTAERPEWYRAATVYKKIGSYYEGLGRDGKGVGEKESILTYWSDLKKLWEIGDSQLDEEKIRQKIAEELLSCVIMETAEMARQGMGKEEIQIVLESIRQYAEAQAEDLAAKQLEEQYRLAEKALSRAYQMRGGS